MLIKIIWVFVTLNLAAWLFFVILFLASTEGRNVDSMETGWMTILFCLGLFVILLAAVPLWISHSGWSMGIAAFFAFLPSVVGLGFLAANMPSWRKPKTHAEVYYTNKTQRKIATAIEQADTTLLQTLLVGQDVNARGNRVLDAEGLNYLQFAVRVRNNSKYAPFDGDGNVAVIRLLVAQGCAATPALAEGVGCLPPQIVALLLEAGANPNTPGYSCSDPLLFDVIGSSKEENDMALLLIRKGAHVDAVGTANYGMTPVMYAANKAQTSGDWKDVWRVVRYMLEEAHCDYQYATAEGVTLGGIIRHIQKDVMATKAPMTEDYRAVVAWLKEHHVDVEPAEVRQ